MKFDYLEALIDQFFDSISPNEVVALFEEVGYEFEHKSSYKKINLRKEVQKPQINLLNFSKAFAKGQITPVNLNYSFDINSFHGNKATFMLAEVDKIEIDKKSNFKESDSFSNYAMAA